MPDISKCWGRDCPIKEKCYRYTCKPYEVYQSYTDFTDALEFIPSEEKDEQGEDLYQIKCEYQMPIYP